MNNTPTKRIDPFRPLQVNQVNVGGFFGPRIDTIATKTAHVLLDRCIAAGMLDQVDPLRPNPGIVIPIASGHGTSPQVFWDSDLAKSIETAAYALHRRPDPVIEARVDEVIEAYGRLQEPDGYLNSWYIRIQPGYRWRNLRENHELYCAGHLIEAAVAWFHATGKRRFVDILCRYADHIAQTFGAESGQIPGYPGHPEIELALVRLARATGQQRYLDLARYFVDQRGASPFFFDDEARARGEDPADYVHQTLEYCQAHRPLREQDRIVGHAVRAAYLYSGMADVAAEFGDTSLDAPLEKLWSHLTERNLYVTGGFGPSAHNEGLTFDYDLPNDTAYAETCASVALVFWASRMLGRAPDSRFADVMEQALYNGVLSGISLDGERFFYDNPLESRGDHHRWTWHRCPCCPPNISRLITSIGSYLYGVSFDEIAVHLYCTNTAELNCGGQKVRIAVQTDYPADGRIRMTIDPDVQASFRLALRLPGWCRAARLTRNGQVIETLPEKGYLRLAGPWSPGDVVELDLDMPPRVIFSHPKVGANQGRLALARGPVVYCLEQADNGEGLNSLIVRSGADWRVASLPHLSDLPLLEVEGTAETADLSSLYSASAPARSGALIRAVPYHAWDNRGSGEMLVWMRYEG